MLLTHIFEELGVDEPLEKLAREVACTLVQPENGNNVRVLGELIVCHSSQQASDMLIKSRFTLLKALVSVARAHSAKAAGTRMAEAFGGGS